MHLPGWHALLLTTSKILTPTAFKLLTNFSIILALISASLSTSKLLSDFHYLFHHNLVFVFILGYKSFGFCFVDGEKKKLQVK